MNVNSEQLNNVKSCGGLYKTAIFEECYQLYIFLSVTETKLTAIKKDEWKTKTATFGESSEISIICLRLHSIDSVKITKTHHHTLFRESNIAQEVTKKLLSRKNRKKEAVQLHYGNKVLSQCGNFSIFLSLRIYVKSIFEMLEVLKLPFCDILETLNFDFTDIFMLHKVQKSIKNKNSEPRNMWNGNFWSYWFVNFDFT